MKYYSVYTGDQVRFESISLAECEDYAKKLYKAEGVIPEIYEAGV